MSNRKMALSLVLILIIAATLICAPNHFKSDINRMDDTSLYTKLVAMDGIGPTLAGRIVTYRNEHKPIKVNDLDNVSGIGEKKLTELKRRFKE